MTMTISNRVKLTNYWKERAQSFPRPSQKPERAKSRLIIERIKAMGVAVAGTRILEIGCGTGLMTLPLAGEAEQVTALDLSHEMLAILEDELTAAGLSNVVLRRGSWQSFDPRAKGLGRSWDSVWAVRSTAVNNLEDLERMEQCAKTWCVFAGAEAIARRPSVIEDLLACHGIPSILSPSPSDVCGMLEQRGRKPARETIRLTWKRKCSVEECLKGLTRHVELYDASPQRAVIEEALRAQCPGGLLELTNRVVLGLVVWRVPG